MSSDARSLLRAATLERGKKNAPGIADPFASYSSSTGALRCSACNYLAIKHENLWATHIVSKSHRTNTARIREEEIVKRHQDDLVRQSQAQHTKDGKRKAEDSEEPNHQIEMDGAADRSVTKRARNEEVAAVDPEWEMFKKQMEAKEKVDDDSYDTGAIVEVQPQLHSNGKAPSHELENELETQEETAAQERARQEQEEREEILSRYEEEQRLQDEGDERVSALKQRLERIRQARKQKAKIEYP